MIYDIQSELTEAMKGKFVFSERVALSKRIAKIESDRDALLEALKSMVCSFKMTQLLMDDAGDRALTREIVEDAQKTIALCEAPQRDQSGK